jgi:hypothetical protein
MSELLPLSRSDKRISRHETLRNLKRVLETYTGECSSQVSASSFGLQNLSADVRQASAHLRRTQASSLRHAGGLIIHLKSDISTPSPIVYYI